MLPEATDMLPGVLSSMMLLDGFLPQLNLQQLLSVWANSSSSGTTSNHALGSTRALLPPL
jgi:hypothetical protein